MHEPATPLRAQLQAGAPREVQAIALGRWGAAWRIRAMAARALSLSKNASTCSRVMDWVFCATAAFQRRDSITASKVLVFIGFVQQLQWCEDKDLRVALQEVNRHHAPSVGTQTRDNKEIVSRRRLAIVGAAKLSARAALASTGSLPENVNYAVKSSFLLSFLESVPELAGKLPDPHSGERKFEDVVKDAQQASVLVLVY